MADKKLSGTGQDRTRRSTYALTLSDPKDMAKKAKRAHSHTFRFGWVEAKTSATDPLVKSANVVLGQEALKRAKNAFTKQGVSLRHGKTVPVYYADPKEPSVLIRKYEGREERGRFVGKAFVPSE
jgi:hypothetical protein